MTVRPTAAVPEGWRAVRLGDVCDTPRYGANGPARPFDVDLTLLTEFGMTLPPETEPLRGFGRAGQLNWRRAALDDIRRALARRRLLRRVLTLGLWRG